METYKNPFKIGDVVRLKEDSAPNPAWGMPGVSTEIMFVVKFVSEDMIFVECVGFLRSWAYAKFFELAVQL